jgi:AraC-like DNA-binding protein
MTGYAALTLHQYRRLRTRALRSEQAAVFLVREGSKQMGLQGRSAGFAANRLGLIPPRLPVDIENRPGPGGRYRASAIALPDEIAARFAGTGGDPLQATASRRAAEAFNRAEALLQDPATPSALKDHAAREVMLWLAEDGIGLPPFENPGLQDRLRRMITAGPAEGWTAEGAARDLAVSPATLRRRLAAEGTSFTEVLTDVRMTCGLVMLQSTGFAVARIAEECGYASPSRFAARFRTRFGCAPADIRNPAFERSGTEVERTGTV